MFVGLNNDCFRRVARCLESDFSGRRAARLGCPSNVLSAGLDALLGKFSQFLWCNLSNMAR